MPVSPKILASFIDFNYNVGEAAFCKSSIVKRLNAGDYAGACEGFRPYVLAGGQFRQGLLNRRIDEIALCREGIKDLQSSDPYACFGAGRYDAMREGRECPK